MKPSPAWAAMKKHGDRAERHAEHASGGEQAHAELGAFGEDASCEDGGGGVVGGRAEPADHDHAEHHQEVRRNADQRQEQRADHGARASDPADADVIGDAAGDGL